jgi:hypothetical protein
MQSPQANEVLKANAMPPHFFLLQKAEGPFRSSPEKAPYISAVFQEFDGIAPS